VAARIAAVERKLPWFWSYTAEGLSDIPYTYEVRMSRKVSTRGGKEIGLDPGAAPLLEWRTLQLERIPLEFGAFMRCLSQDGASPCSTAWNQELERQSAKRDAMTAEERARAEAARDERRQRRHDFWERFPAALRLTTCGNGQLCFSPLPGGPKVRAGANDDLLAAIDGRLRFDPETCEITGMEYDLTRDVNEPFARLPKAAHFEIELARSADQHYVPSRTYSRRTQGKAQNVEERSDQFANFRRFGSESRIEFGDREDPVNR
jgi:hypothetical protein